MATGACGIHCDVCHLNLKGICSTCGPGRSDEAARKLAAQEKNLGQPCPVLACARMKGINYCLGDCHDFPCENFKHGPYPFSRSFIAMHERRKNEAPKTYAPDGSHLKVDEIHWETVAQRELLGLCNLTFFDQVSPEVLQFRFLNENVRINIAQRRILLEKDKGIWSQSDDPLLGLVTVMYLKEIQEVYPMGKDIVGAKDLKEGQFFTGPHEFRLQPVLNRYKDDPDGFRSKAIALGGEPLEMADAAFRLLPFPRVALYYLLWLGDEEFKPRIQVLFDRSIESYLAADAIWALVNRVAMAFGSP